ncbi:hydroxyacylglutathione hydrolase [Sinobacterium caligoides]|uniref:Hydroxyacylglutathione hydrolase n=1 Tax=Sinobacterium caligoides TaxID=933926 RepID=A0A3N2DJM3_9GAMM|nr:hydroxyacylglutathione hydrolase [Sinobacterium caligoides]ROR99985.1 hydroxyacylglutathione hydrolase [Sinobacterium caligoides]
MLNISAIKAYSDNYIWLLDDTNSAVIVDPGDAEPVIEHLEMHQLQLKMIIVTHHHFDHVGGIAALCEKYGAIDIIYPANSPYQEGNRAVSSGDSINILSHTFDVITVPGHTLDHVCYYSRHLKALFSGDTLFAGGCGRVFEGTSEQMYHSLQKLADLPSDTRVYCAHEYTLSNLRFALTLEPNNDILKQRLTETEELRRQELSTLPSTIGEELASNPFLRCHIREITKAANLPNDAKIADSVATFAAIRELKNHF